MNRMLISGLLASGLALASACEGDGTTGGDGGSADGGAGDGGSGDGGSGDGGSGDGGSGDGGSGDGGSNDGGSSDGGSSDGGSSDGGSSDGGSSDGGSGDGGSGTGAPWAGTWTGEVTLDIEEGGFVPTSGNCAAELSVVIPDDTTETPIGSGSLTCAPSSMSSAEWTFSGTSVDAETWEGEVTIEVSGWTTGSAKFEGSFDGDALTVVVEGDSFASGDWYYLWPDSTLELTKE